jgi:tetratricopeptide (TPR) repeat protein
MLNGMERGSFVLTKSWDIYSPILYLQIVENIRRDVVLVDYELMRRSWYVTALSRKPVGHSGKTLRIMSNFAEAVRPFERGEPYDASSLESLFRVMLNSLLEDAISRGSTYLDFLDETHLAQGYLRVPHLMSYRLSDTIEINLPGYDTLVLGGVTDPEIPRDDRASSLLERYWIIAANRGYFLIERGRYAEAADALEFALELAPDNLSALRGLAYCFTSLGMEGEAREILEKIQNRENEN